MKLYITDNLMEDCPMDVVQMSTAEFNMISSHPWIASSRFDVVVIDVTDNLKYNMILPLMKTTRVVPRFEEVNNTVIVVLCAMFKDRAAELRYNFIRDKVKCIEIINQMRKDFNWDIV